MLEFREPVVQLRPEVKLKAHRGRLAGLELKPRHTHRALDSQQAWPVPPLDVEGLRPDFAHFRVEWCDNAREKLVRHGGPLRANYFFLEDGLGRSFLDADDRIILRGEPAHIGRLWFALDAPNETGVGRHIS